MKEINKKGEEIAGKRRRLIHKIISKLIWREEFIGFIGGSLCLERLITLLNQQRF